MDQMRTDSEAAGRPFCSPRRTWAIFAAAVAVLIAAAAVAGAQPAFDPAVLRAFREPGRPGEPIGPDRLTQIISNVSALGSFIVLSLITVFAFVGMLLAKRRAAAALVLGVTVTGWGWERLLKAIVDRPRPSVVTGLEYVTSASFPSGHAMLSMTLYMTLAMLLADALRRRRGLGAFAVIAASLLTLLIGFSRTWLGVHYPLDVLGGWSAGLAWVMLCWRVYLRRGRQIDLASTGEE